MNNIKDWLGRKQVTFTSVATCLTVISLNQQYEHPTKRGGRSQSELLHIIEICSAILQFSFIIQQWTIKRMRIPKG